MPVKKSKYASIVTYNPTDEVRYEPVSSEQVTVAGESYTIPELFARLHNGHDPQRPSNVFFEDTEDFESIDFSKLRVMDLAERQNLYEQVTERAKNALRKIEEHRKETEAVEPKKNAERSGEVRGEASKADNPPGSEVAPGSLDNTGAK